MNRVDFILNEKKSVHNKNSMKKFRAPNLVVNLKLVGNIIECKILHQNDKLRGPGGSCSSMGCSECDITSLWEENGYRINSCKHPSLLNNTLFIKGEDKDMDVEDLEYRYHSVLHAEEALKMFKKGIEEINKGNYKKINKEGEK